MNTYTKDDERLQRIQSIIAHLARQLMLDMTHRERNQNTREVLKMLYKLEKDAFTETIPF